MPARSSGFRARPCDIAAAAETTACWARDCGITRPLGGGGGYRRLLIFLWREGWSVNAKCVHRLYRVEGLAVRRRVKKRVALERPPLAAPARPNEQWSLGFVSDTLADSRRFRSLTFWRSRLNGDKQDRRQKAPVLNLTTAWPSVR